MIGRRLDVDSSFRLPDLARHLPKGGRLLARAAEVAHTDRYDTPDGRLAASGMSLTHRPEAPTPWTATVPVPGSWAISQFNYRLGTGGSFTETTTQGTLTTGGTKNVNGALSTTTAASGNVIYMEDANIIAATGLVSGLTTGSVAVTGAGAGASGTHFQAAIAVFAPLATPTVINLPATNFNLANGTKLSVNGPGDAGECAHDRIGPIVTDDGVGAA